MVQGFGLEPEAAERLLIEDYNPRCVPEWNVSEIRHKVESALKDYRGARRRGWLLESGNNYQSGSNYQGGNHYQSGNYPGGSYPGGNYAPRPVKPVSANRIDSGKGQGAEGNKPKPVIVFYRQDRADGYFGPMVKEAVYSGKPYRTEYRWDGFRYVHNPDGRVLKDGRTIIEDWIHLYDDGAGLPYQLVNRMKWSDGRKIPALYHWEASRGRYEAGSGELPRIPYRAVELKEASFVRIVEGEKCADCLAMFLASQGILNVDNAVTCFGGCTSFRLELACWFRGKSVLIYSDNDEAGRKFSRKVSAGLASVAASVRILERWPEGFPEHGDIADLILSKAGRGAA